MGVEPTYQPWEGRILPMNYTRISYFKKYTLFLPVRQGVFMKNRCRQTTGTEISIYFLRETAYLAFSAIPSALSLKRSSNCRAGPLLP